MKISVVTPTFNQLHYLRRTCESILTQSGNFELQWIVIDGGSSDGTIEFLRGLRDPRVFFVSEVDRGQGHAINKGLALAEGEIAAWLNGDDVYTSGALAAVAEAFQVNPSAKWLVGRCGIMDANDRPIRSGIARYKDWRLARYSLRALLRENFIAQPAVFWRALFARGIGPLDESLHWTMDYDLWLRMARLADPLVLDKVLARFRLHRQSKSGQVDRRQFDEGYEVARRYLGGDRFGSLSHRLNVEKIVWSYRLMRAVRR